LAGIVLLRTQVDFWRYFLLPRK